MLTTKTLRQVPCRGHTKHGNTHKLRILTLVYYGRAELVQARRADVLTAAYTQHPERFVRKPPQPPALPTAVWINEPREDTTTTQ